MKNILLFLALFGSFFSLSAQCLYTPNVASHTICDVTANDEYLWNNVDWWDNVNLTHDLSDVPAGLISDATDTCNATISAKYLLFLDLNGDDTIETVIKSWDPPAPGTVNYNNYNNPGYSGGEVRSFDERAVPTTEKYQFALKTTLTGNTLYTQAVWNTQSAPATSIILRLPYGTHRIEWIYENSLSNQVACNSIVFIEDCKAPTVVCNNTLGVNIMPGGQVTLWATDFLTYAEDNATPTPLLEYGIRKNNSGTGFPLDGNGDPVNSVTFNCNEIGLQGVELWSIDLAGNADFCQTYIDIQDNNGNCGGSGGSGEAPLVLCKGGLAFELDALGVVDLAASSVLHAVYDDTTPTSLLDLGIRRSGTGSGFPVDGNGDPVESISLSTADLGQVMLEVWARDTGGHADFCQTSIAVIEHSVGGGQLPTVVCKNNLHVNILPSGAVQIWAADLLLYAEDNDTPTALIELAVRRSGSGAGFPVDGNGDPVSGIIFTCNDLGTQGIELWARDQFGNADFCETYLTVQDNNGNCNAIPEIEGTVCINRWCDHAPVSNVSLAGVHAFDQNGCYKMTSYLLGGLTYLLTPQKDDDYMSGLDALDLVKMSRHILGLEILPLYAIIAADANKSNSVTTFDIVEYRKLINGIYQEFPNNTSWRFVDAAFVFPNQANPFQSAFPSEIQATLAPTDTTFHQEFVAIKIGDVNCDGMPGAVASPNDRQVQFLNMPDASMTAGETLDIPVSFTQSGSWLALQSGFSFDPELLEIVSITPGNLPGMDENVFAEPAAGTLNMVWFNNEPCKVETGSQLFSLKIRARRALQLSQAFQLAHATPETPRPMESKAYDAAENVVDLKLLFRDAENAALAGNIVSQAQPNPTTGAASIAIQLAKSETIRFSLHDVSGKQIWFQELTLPAGAQQLDIPATVLPKAGIYGWQLQTGETLATGKLVKI